MGNDLVIGIVGPCKSGKSVLKQGLASRGIKARHIAQEHSHAPQMWQKIAKPDLLVYLDVSYPETLQRSTMKWSEADYQEQLIRLNHARKNADLYIDTNTCTPLEVLEKVLKFLEEFSPN